VGLFDRNGRPWSLRSPLYAAGMVAVAAGFALHLYGFVLRWIASGRAPLSNGHESLLWVALAAGLAGLLFEPVLRMAAAGALGALTAALFLGVSMMATFDPAIGPLVPVLNSYWLNMHVTIITASYGFLGLSCLLGLLVFWLFFTSWRKGQSAVTTEVIDKLDRLNVSIMIAGLGLLAVGTLLGGVWANESWGRYWGWDPKETWALISVLWYAMGLHFRWIPKLANPWVQASGAFLGIWFIIMTYFGVNYLLVGLHSYAAGESSGVPLWAALSFSASLMLCIIAFFAWYDDMKRRTAGRQPAAS
jgi:cytochrome c-type biogenesis protein CcsB